MLLLRGSPLVVLKEIDDGGWNVYFGPLRLGRLLKKRM
jgi:hypothetical protein